MEKYRSSYWDSVKGLLIFLVVLGHTGTALGEGLLSIIYAFHMPLFILVSGYLTRKRSFCNWIKSGRGKRLIIIYLVFDIAYIGFDLISGNTITFNRLITPSFGLWYILSLLYWRLFIHFVPEKILNHSVTFVITSIVTCLLVGLIPIGNQMSFQRTFCFFPFFLLGYYMRQSDNILQTIKSWHKVPMLVLFVGLSAINYCYMPVFYANTAYSSICHDMLLRLIQLIIAVFYCISILNLIPEKFGKITELGKCTLLIYLLHPPIIKISKIIFDRIGIEMGIVGAFATSIVTVIFLYMIRKFRPFCYLA